MNSFTLAPFFQNYCNLIVNLKPHNFSKNISKFQSTVYDQKMSLDANFRNFMESYMKAKKSSNLRRHLLFAIEYWQLDLTEIYLFILNGKVRKERF